jgi:hypothetical protein
MTARAAAHFALLSLALISEAAGQSFYGGVRGAVRDPDGVVPGVELTLVNQETHRSRTTVSNGAGEYAFPAVVPGTYALRAVRAGYKTLERVGFAVATQEVVTLDLQLEVGPLLEQVTVTGAGPVLEQANASTGQVLDKKTIDILPNHGRNPYLIASTMPTVVAFGDPHFDRQQDQNATSFVALGGAQMRTNNFLIDGVPTTTLAGAPSAMPTLEALAEVKVQVHTYDAEMGRTGGGVFNATARSGSNTVQGSAFYQTRPVWGQANDFFAERAGIPKPTDLYHRLYGGSFGGPIVKDKTFFWVAFEGYREKTTRTGQLFFPTARERSGDFSQTFDANGNLVVIYDPLTTRQLPDGTYTRDPFPGNVIPAGRLSPVARNILSYFPLPDADRSAADGSSNYVRTAPIVDAGDMAAIKVEQKLGPRISLTGLYLFNNTNEPAALFWGSENPADPDQGILHRQVHILAFNNTVVVDPRTVVTLRFGWTRYDDDDTQPVRFDLASLGFPPSFVDDVTVQMFPGGCIDDSECFGGFLDRHRWSSWGLSGNVSKLLGRHGLKLGGDFRRVSLDSLDFGDASGFFGFWRGWTQADPFQPSEGQGSGIASFLLGVPYGDADVARPLQVFTKSWSAYVQDDFRVRDHLTLNIGLRYEYEAGLREKEDRFTVAFDRDAVSPLASLTGLPLRGGLRYAGVDGAHDYQGDPSKLKLSPRVGAAWTVDPKTVVRGGYGLFWSPWNYGYPNTLNYGQIGYSQRTVIRIDNPLVPSSSLDDPFPHGLLPPVGNSQGLLTGAGSDVGYVSQTRKSPRVRQFSVDVQRQLPGRVVASIAYSGVRGDDLNYGDWMPAAVAVNINQLPVSTLALGPALYDEVSNPFFGIPEAGDFSQSPTIARGQLLRPFPQFGQVLEFQTSGARLRYHAVTAMMERRLADGWGGRVHYTWSRRDSDQFGEGSTYSARQTFGPQNNYDLAAEYSRSLQDVPHRLVVAPVFELPFGEGRRWLTHGLGNALLGAWTIALVARFESGSPLAIVQANDNSGSFSFVQRPNPTGTDPNTPGTTLDRLDHYINPDAYAFAAPFTFGTQPRTDPRIRSPFRSVYDLAVTKDVKVSDRLKGQLRLEWLNLTNSATFFGGNGALGNPAFGTITEQASYPRLLQVTFRAMW